MTAIPSEPDQLQFERADFGTVTAPACAVCQAPLSTTYFEINGATSCEACARAVQLTANAPLTAGGLVRAFVFGAGAALAGAALWFAVAKLTGFEVGLISIVIGVMVGRAVLYGNRGRGAPLLQALAVGLTYASITLSYVPDVVQYILKDDPAKPAAAASTDGTATDTAAAPIQPAAATTAEEQAPSPLHTAVALAAFFVLCFAIAAAAPFLAGFENIIGIVIIAIGLYEAWKITRRVTPAVTGPLDLRTRPAA